MLCVVGADGFFGSYFQKHIFSSPINEPVVCFNHTSGIFLDKEKADALLELHDKNSVKRAAEILSDYDDIKILFLASVHNPDTVKKDPERAEYINTVCYENFLKEISNLPVKKLIYSSSDTVYGESTNGKIFTENDIPSPINIYGKQKLLAEKITHSYGFTVARYSYMCAPSLTPKKLHFFDEVARTLKSGKKFPMLTDWVRSSLSYKTASEITYKLLLSEADEKTVNICSDTPTSKYDIGLKIAEFTACDPSLVVPCTMEELGIFTEKRAGKILMDNSLSKKIGIAENTELIF